MKNLLPVFLFASILISCQESQKTIQERSNTPSDIPVNNEQVDPSTFMKGIEGNWKQLTERNGKLVAFYPCDADNGTVEVRKDSGQYEMVLGFGHDAMLYTVTSMRNVDGGVMLIGKYIDLEGSENDSTLIKFDKEKNILSLDSYENGKIAITRIYTQEDNNSYEKIEQPCRECFTEEECASMGSK